MERATFDKVCAALPATFNVIQWGNASVWKVGDAEAAKVFAIHSEWGKADVAGIVVKPSEMAAEIWRGTPGIALAPYLGRAGWIKIDNGAISAAEISDLIGGSYAINAAKLTKAKRSQLGIA